MENLKAYGITNAGGKNNKKCAMYKTREILSIVSH